MVCGLKTETCCLTAGFALFDARLQPTPITDLTVGSSVDRTGGLGIRFWQHHFKHMAEVSEGCDGNCRRVIRSRTRLDDRTLLN